MKKILILGADGQLGSEIKKISHQWSFDFIFAGKYDIDILDLNNLLSKMDLIYPDYIINCAAYTDVDNAELDKLTAEKLNSNAIGNIAEWTKKHRKKLIHLSTDYVFNGNSKKPLNENSSPLPINFYGHSKLLGENLCLENDPNSIIIRTSWLYSSFGSNFVKSIYNLMRVKDSLNIVNDQKGSPTYALDLAETILKIISFEDWIPGIYHYSNEGAVTWYDFACAIKKICGMKTKLYKITSDELKSRAERPKFTVLDTTKIKKAFNIEIPEYKISLKKCLKIIIGP